IQDSAELRPTGGFIGNYGLVRLSGGRIADLSFADTGTLDVPYQHSGASSPIVAPFSEYLPFAGWWALRDSNVYPDFPTSARRAAAFTVEEGGAERVDGVIGLT